MGMRVSKEVEALILQRCREAGTLPAEPSAVLIDDGDAEADLDAAVVKEAKRCGWLTYHTRNSRKSEAGFPDRVLVRGNRVIFAELKSATGRLTAAQETWREALQAVGGNVVYRVWHPADWQAIIEELA